MFKQIKPNLVQSDEGFSVQTTGWTGIIYTQGEKTINVDSEFLMGPQYDIVVNANIKKWDSGDEISDSERKLVVNNIVRALRFQGMKVDVVSYDTIMGLPSWLDRME
jgi:hypothetical protein